MVGYKLLGLVAVRTTRCGFFFFFNGIYYLIVLFI